MEVELTNYISDKGLTLVKYFEGQKIKRGAKSGQIRNSYCLVSNIIDNVIDYTNNDGSASIEQYYITLVNEKGDNKDIMIFDNLEKFKKIDNKENPVWYKMSNGYVATNFIENKKKVFRYFHQHLLNHYNTKDCISIDHINRCRTDNRLSNLRLATQSEQNYNQVRKRGTNINIANNNSTLVDTNDNADNNIKTDNLLNTTNDKTLKFIKSIIPKYIGYRPASIDKKSGAKHAEHFTIEIKIPNQLTGKTERIRKKTTKSIKYTIAWKLVLALKIRWSIIKNNNWLLNHLDITNDDAKNDFIAEQQDLINQLLRIDNYQATKDVLNLDNINVEPSRKLKRVNCSTCGKEVSKEALLRHIKLKHPSGL